MSAKNPDLAASLLANCLKVREHLIWRGPYKEADGMPMVYDRESHAMRHVRRVYWKAEHGELPAAGLLLVPKCGQKGCLACLKPMTRKEGHQLAASFGAFDNPARIRKMSQTQRARSRITEEMVEAVKAARNAAAGARETGMSHSHAKYIRRLLVRAPLNNPWAGL